MKISASYFFNAISYTKDIDQFSQGEIDKDYSPFVVNRMVAQYRNLIFFADEMNCSHNISKKNQLIFYNELIPKKKRRTLWVKNKKDIQLDIISRYYKINFEKASDYLKILRSEQIIELEKRMESGGAEK